LEGGRVENLPERSVIMGHFRQTPRGMNGAVENIQRSMVAVDLDDLAYSGSRAQRRWAEKKLRKGSKSAVKKNKRA
jgi:hypothetical protein